MPPWIQHLLVFILVAGCLAVVLVGVIRALRGRSSSIGRCCAKGCPTEPAPASPQETAQRVAFLPADSLVARARRKR